jgi:hypothetical protein
MRSPQSGWSFSIFSAGVGAVYIWKREYIFAGAWLLLSTSLIVELIIDVFKDVSEPAPPGRWRRILRAVPAVWLLGCLVAGLVLHWRL